MYVLGDCSSVLDPGSLEIGMSEDQWLASVTGTEEAVMYYTGSVTLDGERRVFTASDPDQRTCTLRSGTPYFGSGIRRQDDFFRSHGQGLRLSAEYGVQSSGQRAGRAYGVVRHPSR